MAAINLRPFHFRNGYVTASEAKPPPGSNSGLKCWNFYVRIQATVGIYICVQGGGEDSPTVPVHSGREEREDKVVECSPLKAHIQHELLLG